MSLSNGSVWLRLTLLLLVSPVVSAKNTVYIQPNDNRFHLKAVHSLTEARPIALEHAQGRGYKACTICYPDHGAASSDAEVPTIKADPPVVAKKTCRGMNPDGSHCTRPIDSGSFCAAHLPQPETLKSVTGQCLGYTKKGARCKRMVVGGGYCYQHKR